MEHVAQRHLQPDLRPVWILTLSVFRVAALRLPVNTAAAGAAGGRGGGRRWWWRARQLERRQLADKVAQAALLPRLQAAC